MNSSLLKMTLIFLTFTSNTVLFGTTNLKPGKKIKVEAISDLNEKNVVEFRRMDGTNGLNFLALAENVVNSEGQIVIPKGQPVFADITIVAPQDRDGIPGKLAVTNLTTTSTTGEKILLPGKIEITGKPISTTKWFLGHTVKVSLIFLSTFVFLSLSDIFGSTQIASMVALGSLFIPNGIPIQGARACIQKDTLFVFETK